MWKKRIKKKICYKINKRGKGRRREIKDKTRKRNGNIVEERSRDLMDRMGVRGFKKKRTKGMLNCLREKLEKNDKQV